jgi:hypothetical protein
MFAAFNFISVQPACRAVALAVLFLFAVTGEASGPRAIVNVAPGSAAEVTLSAEKPDSLFLGAVQRRGSGVEQNSNVVCAGGRMGPAAGNAHHLPRAGALPSASADHGYARESRAAGLTAQAARGILDTTHERKRPGVTSLFAAMAVSAARGEVRA